MKETIAAIVTAIIGLAVVAVIVSRNANTSGVIQSAGSALGFVIGAATSPVTSSGSPMSGNLLGAGSGNFGNGII